MGSLLVDLEYFREATCAETSPRIFDRISRVLTKAVTDGFAVHTPGSLYDMLCGEMPLWSVLFEHPAEFGLDMGDVSGLLTLIDQCLVYDAGLDLEYSVRNQGAPSSSSAYGEAYRTDSHLACGVLAAPRYSGGIIKIEYRGSDSRSSFLVCEERDLLGLYRFHLGRNMGGAGVFTEFSVIAFPDLLFVPSVSPADLGVDLHESGGKVVAHLSFLNDDYIDVCEECAWDLPRVQAAARARGVDLSDESSNTKADHRKLRQRNVSVVMDGRARSVSCTLHTKLSGQRGRIHYSVERVGADERQVVVGIMHAHLPV